MPPESEAPALAADSAEPPVDGGLGESRLPPALALLAFLALNVALRIWLPHAGAVRVPWLVPGVEAVLLVILLGIDPSSDRLRVRRLHRVASSWSLFSSWRRSGRRCSSSTT